MLDAARYATLRSAHPALATLSEKVSEILRDELRPDEEVRASYAAQISGSDGALIVTDKRVVAVWLTKLLFIFKLPTIQEFHLEQLNELNAQDKRVYMHASADPKETEDDYEEGMFDMNTRNDALAFIELVQPTAPRLQ